MSVDRHVSVFDLDVWFASPSSERATDVSAHLTTCATCKQYVARLELDRAPRRSSVLRRLAPIPAALALAAALFFLVRPATREPDESSYVGVKGVPAAQVLVRSGASVRVWDGTSRVRPGDALAVRVACAELSHVTVASGGARAWEGPCPAAPAEALPFTLVVDAQPGREHFDVVLTRERLDDTGLARAIASGARTGEAWTIAFDFDKEDKQ